MPALAQATCGGDTAPRLPVGGGVRGCGLTRVKFASKKAKLRSKMIMGKRFACPTIACDPSLERAKKAPDTLADPTFVVSRFLGATPLN